MTEKAFHLACLCPLILSAVRVRSLYCKSTVSTFPFSYNHLSRYLRIFSTAPREMEDRDTPIYSRQISRNEFSQTEHSSFQYLVAPERSAAFFVIWLGGKYEIRVLVLLLDDSRRDEIFCDFYIQSVEGTLVHVTAGVYVFVCSPSTVNRFSRP